MTLSEVFYEAACRCERDFYSCHAIAQVVRGYVYNPAGEFDSTEIPECEAYLSLMRKDNMNIHFHEVEQAADAVNWNWTDYRIFMLLMASEAVK